MNLEKINNPGETMPASRAERRSRNPGRKVAVEYRPGAGGNIGAASVVKAAAAGYTLPEITKGHNINSLHQFPALSLSRPRPE